MIIVEGVVLSGSHTVSLFTTVRAKPADKNASNVLIKVKTTASDDKLVNVAAVTPESAGGSISISALPVPVISTLACTITWYKVAAALKYFPLLPVAVCWLH
jgi:hypothetical protein